MSALNGYPRPGIPSITASASVLCGGVAGGGAAPAGLGRPVHVPYRCRYGGRNGYLYLPQVLSLVKRLPIYRHCTFTVTCTRRPVKATW